MSINAARAMEQPWMSPIAMVRGSVIIALFMMAKNSRFCLNREFSVRQPLRLVFNKILATQFERFYGPLFRG